jgi:putative SOS response-associated peptidase YedK
LGWWLPETQPFSFAALWAHNSKLDVTSCTIITMPAGEPMAELHDRQPAIVAPEVYDAWLNPATPATRLSCCSPGISTATCNSIASTAK